MNMLKRIGCSAVVLTSLATGHEALAQCKPVAERTGEIGCWIMSNNEVGQLPAQPIYWHLDTFATRAQAEAARRTHSTVLESLGKIWLLTIDVVDWRPSGGTRVATIGPLPIKQSAKYSAQFMEAIFAPGMTSVVHRHSGPEAWYTAAGETCLETPEGKVIGRPGGPPVIVPEGPPMHLTAAGTETRRALVLILHDSTQPATMAAHDWTPKGLCKVPRRQSNEAWRQM
jgi:quercetin dioxygenase-like cupin family protein